MTDKEVIETFRDPRGWSLAQMRQASPSCFNSDVRVERFRVTVERIEEPVEVIRDRLRKLWADCDNHHHRGPLLRMGQKYGINLHAAQEQK